MSQEIEAAERENKTADRNEFVDEIIPKLN